jgi:hypothetical protein
LTIDIRHDVRASTQFVSADQPDRIHRCWWARCRTLSEQKRIAAFRSILRKSVLFVATFVATQLTTDLAAGPIGGMEVGVGRIALQSLDERVEIARRYVLSV